MFTNLFQLLLRLLRLLGPKVYKLRRTEETSHSHVEVERARIKRSKKDTNSYLIQAFCKEDKTYPKAVHITKSFRVPIRNYCAQDINFDEGEEKQISARAKGCVKRRACCVRGVAVLRAVKIMETNHKCRLQRVKQHVPVPCFAPAGFSDINIFWQHGCTTVMFRQETVV